MEILKIKPDVNNIEVVCLVMGADWTVGLDLNWRLVALKTTKRMFLCLALLHNLFLKFLFIFVRYYLLGYMENSHCMKTSLDPIETLCPYACFRKLIMYSSTNAKEN